MNEEMSPEQMRWVYAQEKLREDLKNVDEEIEVSRLGTGASIQLETNRTKYKLEVKEDGIYISGHPVYCPEPIKADIASFNEQEGVEDIKSNVIKKNWRLLYVPEGHQPVQAGHIKGFELLPRI